MSDAHTQVDVSENGKSTFAVDMRVSGFMLAGDEPEAQGGKNLAPAPYDYLTAALGECTVMTIRWFAQQKGWAVEHIAAEVTHHKEGKRDVFSKKITVTAPELTDEQRAKLVEIAAKCPIQRTLEGTPEIATIG